MMLAIRTPVRAMALNENKNDFSKRVQKDVRKLTVAFDKLKEQPRPDLSKHLKAIVDDIDKTAKKDLKKLQELFASTDTDSTIDIDDDDDFTEVGGVVTFKK